VKLETNTDSTTILNVFGYCDFNPNTIKAFIRAGSFDKLLRMGGEYTLVYTHEGEEGIITSMIGAIQYFYYYDGKRFSHGNCILNVLRQLNLPWDWDWDSVGDLCEQENLVENRTMHKHIKKVPSGTILRFKEGLKQRTSNLLDSILITDASAVDAIDIFNAETSRLAGAKPILSLSGGFDSRVILSSMLKQDIFPTVVTVGRRDNSDMQVAQAIANKFMLEHIRVELSLDDLLNNAERIATITNGSKPVCHWHTYLYPKKARISKEQSFFVGTLGEFARNYYFDKGFLSLLNESFPCFSQEQFWRIKLSRHRTFLPSEHKYLCDELCSRISTEGIRKRAQRNSSLSSGDFLSGGSRYYLEQRVPNFYANGISMYNDSSSWRSPFHNIKWLEVIWNLCDQWKLGSNWHRLAIKRNFPKLLDFPEEKGINPKSMLSKAPPLYWLTVMQKSKYKSYDLSAEWYTDNRIYELILDNTSLLDNIFHKTLCESILDEHRMFQNRTKAISFMLTILYFSIVLNRHGK
jgi:hypothetical protein